MNRRTCFFLATFWVFSLARAEGADRLEQHSRAPSAVAQPLNCTECHTSGHPTKSNPCLAPCPRSAPKQGPDVVLLNQLSSEYVPVIFAHQLHAQMTQMSGGCAICHHHNSANRIMACRECHSASHPESLAKPGLKGAYHRLCLNCHREWSHETQCSVCHARRTANSTRVVLPDPTDIMGLLHPNVKEPVIKIYQTACDQGTLVTFRHQEHVRHYGLKCATCHREEDCSRCHDTGLSLDRTKTFEQHHSPCSLCHQTGDKVTKACAGCHSDKEIPPFTHKEAGLVLNDTHQVAECSDCHTGSGPTKYRDPPSCSNCHEKQENISYPARLPGTKVKLP